MTVRQDTVNASYCSWPSGAFSLFVAAHQVQSWILCQTPPDSSQTPIDINWFMVSSVGWNYVWLNTVCIKRSDTTVWSVSDICCYLFSSVHKHASGSLQAHEEEPNITAARVQQMWRVSPGGAVGLCVACSGYPPGPLQIAGHVAGVTFSMKRCRWGATLLDKRGEAQGGPAWRVYVCRWKGHVDILTLCDMRRCDRGA